MSIIDRDRPEKDDEEKTFFERLQESLIKTIKNSSPVFTVANAVDDLNRNISDKTKNEIEKSGSLSEKALVKAGDVVEGAQRTLGGAGADVAQESLQLVNLIADKTNIYDFDDEMHDKQQEFINRNLQNLFGEETVETVKRGKKTIAKIKEPEYFGGSFARDMTSILGSIFLGTKGVGKIGTLTTKTPQGQKVAEAIAKTSIGTKSAKYGQFLTGATIGEQVSINPYEDRLANFLGEMIGNDEGTLNDLLEYLEADENKSELEARMGLFYEGLAFTAGLPAAWFGSKAVHRVVQNKEEFMKALKDLSTGMKKGSIDTDMFKNILKTASNNSNKRAPHLAEKPDEDVSKLWQFSSNTLKRAISTLGINRIGIGLQELVKSRGFMTPRIFEVFNKSEASKNAWVDATENVVKQMEATIDNLVTTTQKYKNRDKLEANITEALSDPKFAALSTSSARNLDEGLTYYDDIPGLTDEGRKTLNKSVDAKKQAKKDFDEAQKEFNKLVPPALRNDVMQMRGLIDDFSEMFLQLPNNQISKELKETISNNMGKWLHRSYEVFESPALARKRLNEFERFMGVSEGFKKYINSVKNKLKLSNPYQKEFDTATEYFMKTLSKQSQYKDMDPENLHAIALNEVYDVLKLAVEKGDATDYFGRMDGFFGSNRSMLKRKGDIEEPLRLLLGEIKSPTVNILKSISHVSSFIEDTKFASEAYSLLKGRLQRKGGEKRLKGHIFNRRFVDPDTGIAYTTKLKGKQYGKLNGKYMTKEMAMMFSERGGLLGKIGKSEAYKTFLAFKGYGQASKTVFNHITHLRNTIGGVFFSLANGNNPFKDSQKAIKTLYEKNFKDVGEEESLAYYNKLVSLDLVNTGARYGDVKALLKDASESKIDDFLASRLKTFGSKADTLKKYGKNIQNLYIAEDDLFKIVNYEQELASLLKGAKEVKYKIPNSSKAASFDEYIKFNPQYMQDLERQAANIVRNTIPTYSLVPTGIKQLRKLPFGNYFSFPAEMVRTSVNIVEQGLKEMFLSGGPLLGTTRRRGARRLAGFGVAGMFGNEGLNTATKMWHGVSDKEEEALRYLDPYDYSKNSKFIYYRDKDGTLYKNDFSFIDPYDVIKRPLQTAIYKFAHGKHSEENLDKILKEAIQESVSEFARPFVSEAMLTAGIMNVIRGRTSEGYPIKGWDNATPGEFAAIAFEEIAWKPFVPGGFREIPKFTKATMGSRDYNKALDGGLKSVLENVFAGKTGEKDYDLKGQLIANFTGFRFEKVDVKKSLELKAKQYLRAYDDSSKNLNDQFDSNKTGNDILIEVAKQNRNHYYAYKDIKLAVDSAYRLGLDRTSINNILENAGVPQGTRTKISQNKYVPLEISEPKFERFKKENLQGPMGPIQLDGYLDWYRRRFNGLPVIDFGFQKEKDTQEAGEPLIPRKSIERLRDPELTISDKLGFGSAEKLKSKARTGEAKGGFIEGPDVVPSTKEDPAERVNPFTGEPYQEQMKRLGFGDDE